MIWAGRATTTRTGQRANHLTPRTSIVPISTCTLLCKPKPNQLEDVLGAQCTSFSMWRYISVWLRHPLLPIHSILHYWERVGFQYKHCTNKNVVITLLIKTIRIQTICISQAVIFASFIYLVYFPSTSEKDAFIFVILSHLVPLHQQLAWFC